MKRRGKRLPAFAAALLMIFSLLQGDGAAILDGVYFTAVNDQLMPLSSETMPFWSGNKLYICQTAFDGTDLGVRYIRNQSEGLAVLYTSQLGLWFNLANQTVSDKNGIAYSGYAIEKNGYVFFPVDLVCRYFRLRWSLSDTATIPLVRIKSDEVVLDDNSFINAAFTMMAVRYAEYEKMIKAQQEAEKKDEEDQAEAPKEDPKGEENKDPVKDPEDETPPFQALAGQKVYLILAGRSADSIARTLEILGDTPATFLLTAEQMEDGNLMRSILGRGHAAALLVQGKTEEECREELQRARQSAWMTSCSLLQLVWHEGNEALSGFFEEQGCVNVAADLDRRHATLRSEQDAEVIMRLAAHYREDVSIYLGYDDGCADGLERFLDMLTKAQYRLCAWRLTA